MFVCITVTVENNNEVLVICLCHTLMKMSFSIDCIILLQEMRDEGSWLQLRKFSQGFSVDVVIRRKPGHR